MSKFSEMYIIANDASVEEFEEWLKKNDVNQVDEHGESMLHLLTIFEHGTVEHQKTTDEKIRLLIEVGADVNAKDAKGCTAIYCSTIAFRSHYVELLLRAGADPYIKNNKGSSALSVLEVIYDNFTGENAENIRKTYDPVYTLMKPFIEKQRLEASIAAKEEVVKKKKVKL